MPTYVALMPTFIALMPRYVALMPTSIALMPTYVALMPTYVALMPTYVALMQAMSYQQSIITNLLSVDASSSPQQLVLKEGESSIQNSPPAHP